MAVKKLKDTEVKTQEVETVETNVEVSENVEVNTETDSVEEVQVEVPEVEVPEVEVPEVEVPENDTQDSTVEVETDKAQVNTSNKPNGNVKIRMRVDHKCTIAMERYDLKAGKTYTVPLNVKRVLNKAGLLSPL